MIMPRRWRSLPLGLCLFFAAACGTGGSDDIVIIPPPGSPSPSSGVAEVTAEPTPDPTEFRVAYINLMSQVSLDATNTTAADTFEERLRMVIAELKEFKPDIVAFSEVTETTPDRSARTILAQELKMEPRYVRAKPWITSRTKEQNDVIRQQAGFEEGELILVSSRFPAIDGAQIWLNPRTSDFEGPAGMFVELKGPAGAIDVFVSHLTGVDSRTRALQAADFAKFIQENRGSGPIVVLGDFGDPPGSATQKAFLDAGLSDVLEGSGMVTCCRESILGEQPPLTIQSDYIFAANWSPTSLTTFAASPKTRDDGVVLYASDHDGITAVFPLGPPPNP